MVGINYSVFRSPFGIVPVFTLRGPKMLSNNMYPGHESASRIRTGWDQVWGGNVSSTGFRSTDCELMPAEMEGCV